MNKIVFLEKDYEYQRSWITHANNASAIGLTISSLFWSWVLVNNSQTLVDYKAIGLLFILIIGLSIFNYIKVIFPSFLESTSIIYFNGIATTEFDDFKRKIKELSEEKLEDEYIEQIYALAKIAKKKFENFRIALCYSLVTLVICIVTLF